MSPWVFTPLFLFMAAGFYTNLPLDIGIKIVGGFAILPGLVFLLFNFREAISKWPILAVLFACPVIPTVLNLGRGLDPLAGLESCVGLVASLLAAYGLFLAAKKQDRNFLALLLLGLAGVVIVLCALEVYTGFKELSDGVRKVIYEGRFIYQGNARDIADYGHIRPKAFAQEPSGPARFVAYSLAGAVAVSTKRWQTALALFLFLPAFWLIRSPSLYAAAMVIVMMVAIRIGAGLHMDTRLLNAGAVAMALLITVAASDADFLSAVLGGGRGAKVEKGGEGSTEARMLIPPQIFFTSLGQYGVTGTGMGSKVMLQSMVAPLFEAHAGSTYMKDTDGLWDWANAFFDALINMGPLLGVLFICLLPFVFTNPVPATSLIIFEAVFMLDSGLPGARNWAYFGLMSACVTFYLADHIKKANRIAAAPPPKPQRRVRVVTQPN